jgi:thiol-disulfide isomerase/thioredoxin
MSTRPRLLGIIAIAATLMVGCGSSDEPAASPATEPSTTTTETASTEATPTSPSTAAPDVTDAEPTSRCPDGGPIPTLPSTPTATIPADIPDDFVPAIGPVEVYGDPLPALAPDTPIADDPALCAVAPVVLGQNFDGSAVTIDAANQGPTMVVFLAHWCPHCNAEIPRLLELRDAGRYPEGLDIVGVSTSPNPGRPNFPPSEWLPGLDWTYPVMQDGVDAALEKFVVADAFGVNAFPFMVLLDGQGRVAARFSGEHEPDEIIDLINEYLDFN